MNFSKAKRVLSLALGVTLMSFSITACNNGAADTATNSSSGQTSKSDSTSSNGGEYKIGLALPVRDQYFASFETGAQEYKESLGITGDTNISEEDFPKQLSHIQTYATEGYDAVVVGLTDNTSYKEALDAAGDMKVVFFNRKPSSDEAYDGVKAIYVGMSEYDAGYAQGEWLVKHFDEKKADKKLNGVLFRGVLGQAAVTDRSQGAMDALEKGGYTVTWTDNTANWDKTEAMNKFTQILGTGDKIDFVVCNNDEMALGCIEALKASGKEVDFPIVGVDATETGCMAVKDGTLAMTVNQNPKAQGKIVIDSAISLIKGEKPEGLDDKFCFATPAEPVTADNVDDVLATFK